ncbi:MAG: FAD-dependent monooxygenase, partial [Gammaproteobacteria bacterium]|nr:FAD-dependent monooxygenase [Gammaproteobacteria bacterium]
FHKDTTNTSFSPSETQATSNFDDRCLALSYGSLQLLNHWQIWPELKPHAWPIKTIITSDRGHIGKTIMRAPDYGLNAMGHVAAMKNMGQAFTKTLSRLSASLNKSITWFCPDSIQTVQQSKQQITVELTSGIAVSAGLLVVAEGGNSPTRQALQIGTSTEQYKQSAIITNVEVKPSKQLKQYTAFERFTTSGPIAFLPIGEQQYSVVWTVKPDEVSDIMHLPEGDFIAQLQQAFGFAAGKIIKMSPPSAYPLSLIKAEQLIHDRVVFIGNSAHTIHPIAGQGFNLGLRDVAVLVQQIRRAVEEGRDIGAFEVLANFQQLREQDITRIAGFTDTLVRAFAIEGRPAAALRTLGLMTLQKCNSLQQWLAIHFMSSKQLI